MPFEYQSFTTNPNKSTTVKFNQDVIHYLPAVAYYSLSYGSSDHHVEEVALRLSVNQPSPTELSVTVTAVLDDKSGNTIDNAESSVTVVVLAWTGADPGTIQLASASGIPNNGQSGPISLPSSNLSTFQTVFAGFDLSYGNSDHHVLYQGAGTSGEQSGSTGYIVGSAQMSDSNGNSASTATVNGGLIAIAAGTDAGVGFQLLANQQSASPVYANFPKPVKSAAVMLVSQTASFSSDHHIQTLGAGCSGWSINGSQVELKNARAFMNDGSGNHQNDSKSNVSVLVVGFYN